ncbi:MAG TPA: helix-turn-helix domain-containing protein [Candidatus Binatia bacterium]|nr:helix-turn-helix domain-containing protein [Candidatus Binatia bacterium]
MAEPAVLTVEEVASELRLSRSATYGLIRAGILPSARIGRRYRVSRAALVAFLAAGGRGWPGGWRKSEAMP